MTKGFLIDDAIVDLDSSDSDNGKIKIALLELASRGDLAYSSFCYKF